MKVGEAEKYIRDGLNGHYEDAEGGIIALLVLEQVTGRSRTALLLGKADELHAVQEERLLAMVERLQRHEPIQYILNNAPFYGMELYVDQNVLIPRPETEELVDWVITDIRAAGLDVFERAVTEADATQELKILDVGTGSGCIALALKNAMPKAEVWGCDISEVALNVARRNGAELDIRVDFQGINFLDKGQHAFLPAVDIVVSNPPYVPQHNKADMQPNVLRYEPHTALFVPDEDPLLFYKAIAVFGQAHLHKGGAIYLEIHEDLGHDVLSLLENEGYGDVQLRKDMQGKDRMVRARFGQPKMK